MAPRGGSPARARAGWFTPPRLLALFCAMSTLIYLDRGVIGSAAVSGTPGTPELAGSGLQGDFDVDYYAYGLLQAAFMFGLLLEVPRLLRPREDRQPVPSHRGGPRRVDRRRPGVRRRAQLRVPSLRGSALVGVGGRHSSRFRGAVHRRRRPQERKTSWLAAFYMCVPVGVAAGFAFGGAIGGTLGWRWAFAFEAAAMAPVVALCVASPPIPLRGRGRGRGRGWGRRPEVPPTEVSPTSTLDLHPPSTPTPRRLSRSRARVREGRDGGASPPDVFLVVLGYVFYTAVIGVYRRVGSKGGLRRVRRESPLPRAIGRGVRGRDGGGGRDGNRTRRRRRGFVGASVEGAARVCALATLLAFALLECAFAAASFPAFVALFTAGETRSRSSRRRP